MRVGVNLQALRVGQIGGNETYVRQLVRLLPEIDPEISLVLFCADYNAGTFPANIETHVLDAHRFASLDEEALRKHQLDLWFCPLLVVEPASPGIPAVVTIPDLQHEAHPEFFGPDILDWRQRHYGRSARQAAAVLTYSEFSRRQIVSSLGVHADRVHAIHLDAAPGFGAPARDDGDIAARYGLPRRFLFYPANNWPHKNHELLLTAFAGAEPGIDPELHLVLTGAELDGVDTWERRLVSAGLQDRVHHLGFVSETDLPSLYSRAHATVIPSLFEGFGLPAVEAMRCGCPLLCADATSLPEVAADAAEFFDPRSPADLIRAIEALSPRRCRELVAAGRDRAQQFDWRRTAERTLEVMHRAIGRTSARAPVRAGDEPPLVSIVTPSFQQGRFIESTLKSVLEQDYPRIEHWVIDGGSTDETVNILTRYKQLYPERFHFVSEPDGGQAEAINKGISRVNGDVVAWINSDDTYEPGCFGAVVEAFEADDSCDLVYGHADYVAEDGEPLWAYGTRAPFDWNAFAHECFVCQPTVFWRGGVTRAGWRLDESLQLALDYDFWIRLGRDHQFRFLDRHLANSRIYRENKTLSMRSGVYEEAFAVVKRHYGWVPWSWALGRAHYERDGGDAFFNRRQVSVTAFGAALVSLARANWDAPRHWKEATREVRPLVARAPAKLWGRMFPPTSRAMELPVGFVASPDRWLQKTDVMRLPSGWTHVEMEFMLPVDKAPAIEVHIEAGSRRVAEWAFDRAGTYRRRFRVPASCNGNGGPVELSFHSNAALPPEPERGETRHLAARVTDVVDLTPGER